MPPVTDSVSIIVTAHNCKAAFPVSKHSHQACVADALDIRLRPADHGWCAREPTGYTTRFRNWRIWSALDWRTKEGRPVPALQACAPATSSADVDDAGDGRRDRDFAVPAGNALPDGRPTTDPATVHPIDSVASLVIV